MNTATIVVKTLTIKRIHQKWLDENTINLSKFVQKHIDIEIEKYKPLPTMQDDIKAKQKKDYEEMIDQLTDEQADLNRQLAERKRKED